MTGLFLLIHQMIVVKGQQTNGFFIESGAYDGEHLSNTLYFELERNYTGNIDGASIFFSLFYLLKLKKQTQTQHEMPIIFYCL